VRVTIHVRPGSSRRAVGGEHDGALVVRVVEPAEGGRATRAALKALAHALDVPTQAVTLLSGSAARRKIVEIDVASSGEATVRAALRRLLATGGPG
jgi:uncharacterized protein YggU (UPF0235/DUF167 family)